MTFSITVKESTSKQRAVLDKLPKANIHQSNDIATINGVYEEEKRVPDVFRYTILIDDKSRVAKVASGGEIGRFRDKPVFASTNSKIVLIIESPHRDEYDGNFIPIAPAQGSTGVKIDKNIENIIAIHSNLKLPAGAYDLIICNPVQFQTSLFSLHQIPLQSRDFEVGAIRNKVWRAIYNLERAGFYNRLADYAPAAIICACTSNLRNRVCREVKRWHSKTVRNGRAHPINAYNATSHPQAWSITTKLTDFSF